MTTYTIGETATRSGFSASALRYYEGIGLVEPSARSGAGYRLYDEDALARLDFITRAKQLGCTLEEITDLVGLWDGQRCGPVQRRFHELVTEKLAEAETRIAELTALTGQLRATAQRLAGPATDGPCDDACACLVACTIDEADVAERLAQVERLRASCNHVRRTEAGMVLRFPADPAVEAEVRRFAVDEKRCCGFWGFEVSATDPLIELRWEGPPATAGLLDRLHDWFEGRGELPTDWV